MLKKVLLAILVVCLSVALVACAKGGEQAKTQQAQQGATEKGTFESRTWVIGLSQEGLDHPFMITQRKQIMEAASKYPNVKVIATDGQGNVAKQVAGIEDMLAQGIDLLMVQAAKAEGLRQALDKVYERGIPFMFVGKPIYGTKAVTMVTMDNKLIGQQVGQYIVDYLQKKYGEPKGNVVILEGIPGDETSIMRVGGAHEIIDKYPKIKVVAQQPAHYRRPQAVNVMQNILQANPPGTIDVVFAANGEMALGAIQAIKDAGRLKEMIVLGIDGQKEELDAIRAGEEAATWQYKPCGTEGFEIAIKILKGEKVPEAVIVPSQMITKENVDQFEPSF